jgi:hypothetical protein
VDVDAIICGEQRPIEDRHSAAASAAILTVRLFAGVCINIARIANSLEKIRKGTEDDADSIVDNGQA